MMSDGEVTSRRVGARVASGTPEPAKSSVDQYSS